MKTRHELSQGASFSHLRIATASTLFILAAAIVVFAAGEGGDEGGSPTAADGALVRMDMDSQVAVLLDEIPVGSQREAAAGWALAQNTSFWTDRAQRQTRDTYYRLVFRGLYFPSAWANASKVRGPLPLPPQSVWHIQLTNAPARVAQNGHDLVAVNYHFQTYLVTDAASPGAVEPNLAKTGGSWDEPFNLPSDPELLLERTGYACMDEFEYPVGSVFEENTWYFYDDTCRPHSSCHPTVVAKESCVEALQKHTGIVKTNVHFTRVAYDPNTASAFRVGAIANPTGADLSVVTEDMVEQRAQLPSLAGAACLPSRQRCATTAPSRSTSATLPTRRTRGSRATCWCSARATSTTTSRTTVTSATTAHRVASAPSASRTRTASTTTR